jgi:phospholipid transport system substrate-binding protein
MTISDRFSRRKTLGLLTAAGLVPLGRRARAAATDDATALVGSLSAELTRLVNSGRRASQLYGEFERLLVRYADMPAVAASVLGPPWRGASAAQKQSFVAAFQGYLARKYGAQFEEYRNASIEVGAAKDGGRAGVLVSSRVLRPGQEAIAVDWQISARSGRPKVVNLVIEGVSMLASERAEIAAMLEAEKGSLDGLTDELRSRA